MTDDLVRWLTDPTTFAALGYERFPLGPPAPADTVPATIEWAELADHYDAVVIGSGAGGGVAAHVLAAAGLSVLVVERGRALRAADIGWDPVRNHRTAVFGFGEDVTPPGHPRAVADAGGEGERAIGAADFGYHNNAIVLGGGTRLFGAQAWRFAPETFRMASEYGVPGGSALADWPISYDDLEPYYDRVEWEVGVSGEPGHTGDGHRARGYPMPAFPAAPSGRRLRAAAARLGWTTAPVPLMINSTTSGGRPACVRCAQCVGHPCPVDAKNGSHNALLPRAVESGAQLRCDTQVVAIDDGRGTVELCSDDQSGRGSDRLTRVVRADRIVVAAGAVETARLLLLSGLGNEWTGRCLQGHTYVRAHGHITDTAAPVGDGLGPGPAVATRDHGHHNDGVIGGGMLADDFVVSPVQHWLMGSWSRADHDTGSDEAVRQAIADTFRRTITVMGPAQEIPTRAAGVRLSSTVRDRWGLPVVRFFGEQHPEDLRVAAFLAERAREWVEATGAVEVTAGSLGVAVLSGGQHQAGTARMAHTPTGGAVDPEGRVWGSDRTYVADAALHVTNGGVNPVLSVMANAWRVAELLSRN